MEEKLRDLKTRLAEIHDIRRADAVLLWDQRTYMPPEGAAARARQRATLARIAHEKKIDPEMGRLLDQLTAYQESLPYESDDASLIRVARRDFERAIKLPVSFVSIV